MRADEATAPRRTEIRPRSGWEIPDVGEFWRFRELLQQLTLRQIRIRYKQTALGIAWAVVQPVLGALVLALFLGRFAGMRSGDVPYGLFVYTGLVYWTFLAGVVSNSANVSEAEASMVTKVYFPRAILPGATVGAALLDLAVGLAVLQVLLWVYGFAPNRLYLLLPVVLLGGVALALGAALLVCAFAIRFRDIRHVVPLALQSWMFATPIVYPASVVPKKWAFLLTINPAAAYVEALRGVVFGRPIDAEGLVVAMILSAILLVAAAWVFQRMARDFADVL
jgi:lipopolysaccharide transport system permease protein